MKQSFEKTIKEWDIKISVANNPLLWFQITLVTIVSSTFLLLLLVGLNLFEGQWQYIPQSFTVFISIALGLFVAFALVLFLFYWRGISTKYILRDEYIEQHTLIHGKKAFGILGLLALLSGKKAGITAAGAVALASSREQIAVSWNRVKRIEINSKRSEILLKDDWHTLMQVVAPKDQFESIRQILEQNTLPYLQKAQRASSGIPFAYRLMLSAFGIIFGFFMFGRLPIQIKGILAIFMIFSSLIAIWSNGLKRKMAAVFLGLLPLFAIALAYWEGDLSFGRDGVIYAFIVESILLAYFEALAVFYLLRWKL